MVQRAVALIGLALFASSLAAGPATAETESPADDQRRSGVIADRLEEQQRQADLSALAAEHRAALARRERVSMQTQFETILASHPDAIPLTTQGASSPGAPPPNRMLLGTRDLDRDGTSDLLIGEYHEDENGYSTIGVDLVARRGIDGSEIWRAWYDLRDSYGFLEPTGDMDGDGSDDAILVRFVALPGSGLPCIQYATCASDEYRTEFIGLSGADGSEILYHELSTRSTYLGSGYSINEIEAFAADWNTFEGQDGNTDLALVTVDAHVESVAANAVAQVSWRRYSYETTVTILDGSTGQVLNEREVRGAGLPQLRPVGDLDQDGRTDLLLESYAELYSETQRICVLSCVVDWFETEPRHMQALSGASLDEIWARLLPERTDPFVYRHFRDLDGVPGPDLIVETFGLDEQEGSLVEVLAGSSGDQRWDREFGGWVDLHPLHGDIGGSAGEDLLILGFNEVGNLAAFWRLDGGTGQELFLTPTPSSLRSFWVEGDSDGDGVQDIVIGRERSGRQVLTVESGATGTPIARAVTDIGTWWRSGMDANGDGATDLLGITWEPVADGYLLHRSTMLMPSGDILATATFPAASDEFDDSGIIEDVTGDGSDDIFYLKWLLDEEGNFSGSRVGVIEGRDLTFAWQHGFYD